MPQNILIIGAVALGPKTAARFKRLEPQSNVTMIDQGSAISYGGCGIPYYVSGQVESINALRETSAHVIRDPDFFENLKGVHVKLRTRALKINRSSKTVTVLDLDSNEEYDMPYDKLVIATGSTPRLPDIPGMTLANVTTCTSLESAEAIHANCAAQKIKNAIVVGGGFTGLEIAIALGVQWGINTTVVVHSDRLMRSQLSPNLSAMVKHDLEEHGIKVITGETPAELRGINGAVVSLVTNKSEIPAEEVIFSVGVSPNSKIASDAGLDCNPRGGIRVNEYMQTNDPDIYAGGDCVVVKNLISGADQYLPLGSMANRQGRIIGTNLAGGHDIFDGVVGTWCVKLVSHAAAGCGLTEAQARQAGFDPVTVPMAQLDRAHFYPERDMLHMEVVVDKATRRVLGAQAFCANGFSAKARIDAVAAMLQFGNKPTLNDLQRLEVCYTPPFAAAMDAVNTLGNVADNVLAGRHKSITPGEFASLWNGRANNDYYFIDVRPAKSSAHLAHKYPGEWHSIPLEEFEKRINEIPKDRPVALICNSGTRAYECQLCLSRHDIESVNAAGGMQAQKARGEKF
ncbi:MAG: FAD-dependent oxidoreductase [Mailhella sp.]|nr:FAD-dependent oxidoreductase [Mailhella sp.]